MSLAFVILNYKSTGVLSSLLESIAQYCGEVQYKIIIIDVSTDSTEIDKIVYLCHKLFTSHVEIYLTEKEAETAVKNNDTIAIVAINQNLGYSKGNNVGLRLALNMGYQYAMIANPDCFLIDSIAIKRLIIILKKCPNALASFPSVLIPDGNIHSNNPKPYYRENLFTLVFGQFHNYAYDLISSKFNRKKTSLRKVYSSIGCFFAVNTFLFNKIGMFDPDFFLYFEEHVIGEKARKAKMLMIYDRSALIFHNHQYIDNPAPKPIFIESRKLFFRKYIGLVSPLLELLFLIDRLRRLTLRVLCSLVIMIFPRRSRS